jgi:3'(2'), 5'-bisphosphate nucleotidase
VHEGRPVLGLVLLPVGGRLFCGVPGQGAWEVRDATAGSPRRRLQVRTVPTQGLCVAASRSHGDESALQAYLQQHLPGQRVASRVTAGSSLKFGLLAAGEADLYARLGRTMEWDTAAGHAVLLAAGGSVCTLAGAPLRYGKPGFENPHFVARGALPPPG